MKNKTRIPIHYLFFVLIFSISSGVYANQPCPAPPSEHTHNPSSAEEVQAAINSYWEDTRAEGYTDRIHADFRGSGTPPTVTVDINKWKARANCIINDFDVFVSRYGCMIKDHMLHEFGETRQNVLPPMDGDPNLPEISNNMFGGVGKKNTMGRACYLLWNKRVRQSIGGNFGTAAAKLFPSGNDWNFSNRAVSSTQWSDYKINITSGRATRGQVPLTSAWGTEGIINREQNALYPGGERFKSCQQIADADWKVIVRRYKGSVGGPAFDEMFKKKWFSLAKEFSEELNKTQYHPNMGTEKEEAAGRVISYMSKIKEFARQSKEFYSQARVCTAAIWLTSSNVNWDDDEQRKKPDGKRTFDGKISCQSVGPETQDYWPCAGMVEAYNIAQVADKATETIQGIDYMAHTADAQAQAKSDLGSGDHTALLRMQRDDLRKQASMANVRGGFDLAKAGAIFVAMMTVPDISNVVGYCYGKVNGIQDCDSNTRRGECESGQDEEDPSSKKIQSWHFQHMLAYLNLHRFLAYGYAYPIGVGQGEESDSATTLDDDDVPRDSSDYAGNVNICEAVANSGNFNLIMNGRAVDAAKAAMMAAGIEGAANFAKAGILNNQADKVNSAIRDVNDFEPETATFGEMDVMMERCQADPTLDGCDQFDFTQHAGFVNPNIAISGGGGGTGGITGAELESNSSADSGATGDTDRSGTPGGIGESINDVSSANGLENVVGGAGPVKAGGKISGGGGAGSASAGGLRGGGGGAAGAAGGGGGQRIAVAKKAYGGGGGSFSYSGGSFASSKSKKKVANPFAKLLKKGRGGGKKNLNFGRQPASIGNKTSNLWTTISRRYKRVHQNKQLLIYEAK